jgi:ketosteroid isomerase-like protein
MPKPDMNQENLEQLFSAFGKAYFRADAALLESCTSDDFEWHQHTGSSATGTVLKGVEAVCEEIKRRKKEWKEVLYEDFENLFTDHIIVSTFLVSGVDESGERFKVKAVDLYSVNNGKISCKDSYWKQV